MCEPALRRAGPREKWAPGSVRDQTSGEATRARGSWGNAFGGDRGSGGDDGEEEEVHHNEANNDDDEPPKNGRGCNNEAGEAHHVEEPHTNVHDGNDGDGSWESRTEAENDNDDDGMMDFLGERSVPRGCHSKKDDSV